MWKFFYFVMRCLPSRVMQRGLWWVLRKSGIAKLLCDEGFFKLAQLAVTGEQYALPKDGGGINSVILWQRLNWHSDLPSRCSDKYAVREFVAERIGREYLVPLCPDEQSYWTDPEKIDFSVFPNRFVLKLNNGSLMNMLVHDKSKLDAQAVRDRLRQWMRSDYASLTRERQYSKIENKIICEQFIDTPNGIPPEDYKIWCSNGKALFVWVDVGRYSRHQRAVVDVDFRLLPVRITFDRYTEPMEKPQKWREMLDLAAKLSEGIPLVRVDMYNVGGRIYFGEMTFTAGAGREIYSPSSFSREIASNVELI